MFPEGVEEAGEKIGKTVAHSLKLALIESCTNDPGNVVRMCIDLDGTKIKKIVRYNKQNGKFSVSYAAGKEE